MAMRTRALLALAIFAALLSFVKFSLCTETNWATPGQYIHACYSDLPSLFGERGMADNKWHPDLFIDEAGIVTPAFFLHKFFAMVAGNDNDGVIQQLIRYKEVVYAFELGVYVVGRIQIACSHAIHHR